MKGTLAASYLTAGDVVLFVGRCDTRLSTLEELNAVILKSSNRLELTVLKMLNDVICYPYWRFLLITNADLLFKLMMSYDDNFVNGELRFDCFIDPISTFYQGDLLCSG